MLDRLTNLNDFDGSSTRSLPVGATCSADSLTVLHEFQVQRPRKMASTEA